MDGNRVPFPGPRSSDGNAQPYNPFGASWADRWGAIVSSAPRPRPVPTTTFRRRSTQGSRNALGNPPGIPSRILEDLEDYFARFDGQHSQGSVASSSVPDVTCFSAEDLARLRRVKNAVKPSARFVNWRIQLTEIYQQKNPGKLEEVDRLLQKYQGREAWLLSQVRQKYNVKSTPSQSCNESSERSSPASSPTPKDGQECSICLECICEGDVLLEVPCEAKHRFHEKCLTKWLSKSVVCPLCRVDVKALLPAVQPGRAQVTNSRRRSGASSGLGRTADGGTVLRYERDPPSDWERPAYIPAHLRHLAEYLEVSYPNRGTARIWRVPNAATAELSDALPIEENNNSET